MIGDGEAEILEIEIDEDSLLADSTVEEAAGTLGSGVVFGTITRDGGFITPRGGTRMRAGDHVVVFVEDEHLDEVAPML